MKPSSNFIVEFFDYSTETTSERSSQIPRAREIKVLSLFGNVTLFLVGKGRWRDCQCPLIHHTGALALSE